MALKRANQPVVVALWVNAALLLAILVVLAAGGNGRSWAGFSPRAFAQEQAPIAGGAGVFVMPAQFSANTWGCYLLDVDAQTLCAYQYNPGDKQMRFFAARSYKYDRHLADYNTTPSPREIQDLVKKADESVRGQERPATQGSQP